MSDVVDFTNCKKTQKQYEGANGNKICIVYNDELYMLKFPPISNRNKNLSYTNGTISECLGCHILESLGFNVQKTILGIYNKNGKTKIVVACKDFTENNKYTVQPFSALKNTVLDSGHNGTCTELSEILDVIKQQDSYNPEFLNKFFWDLFIGDSLIGNWDRHNGNWGSLYDASTDTEKLAPIFDCGSSMYPSADDEIINEVLNDKEQLLFRVYEIPTSALRNNGAKINYFKYISSLENEDCNAALKRIYPKINLEKIEHIIDETPFITDKQKLFFKTVIKARKEFILEYSYNKLLKREQNMNQEKEASTEELSDFMSFGDKYITQVLEYSKGMSVRDATHKTHEELVYSTPDEKEIKQKKLNTYLQLKGINSNADFANYISDMKSKTKEVSSQKKKSPSRDDEFGRS